MKQENRNETEASGFNGLEHHYKVIDNKKLRFGYTTGSCAAAAAKAAAQMLLTGEQVDYVELLTPKGIRLHLEVLDVKKGEDYVSCAIEKDAGDDPDITNGVWIYAKVSKGQKNHQIDEKSLQAARESPETVQDSLESSGNHTGGSYKNHPESEEKIKITGGTGVGVVTKPGLEQPPGSCAINRVPRQMIRKELEKLCETYHNPQGLTVEISVPEGEKLAEKTFNPRLGIVGGISILGTTGIVEPMSEAALISSIRLELNQQVQTGRKSLVITPGNYGQEFLKHNFPFALEQAVKCSNFVGETIDMAVELGIENILFVSHIGKFIKVAGGIFQTHSRNADARMEILTANAVLAGAGQPLLSEIMRAVTTEEGIRLLEESGYLEKTMEHVMERIGYHLNRRSYGKVNLAALVFSSELGKRRNGNGELGRTDNAKKVMQKIRREQENAPV